jgi:hypothetical protein
MRVLIDKMGSLPILRRFSLYSKPKLIYARRLRSLRYNFFEKMGRSKRELERKGNKN